MARPLIALVLLAEVGHLLAILFAPHPVLASNLLQLFFPLLAAGVCLHQRTFTPDRIARRCWGAVTIAFGIWALAQAIYIYSMYFPLPTLGAIRLDDALWVLFGLPLLVAINTTYDQWDKVEWLDRVQEVLFFVVLYLLVFLRSDRLNLNTAFLIQNLALLLCCLLRLPTCTVTRERRFFVRLAIFLMIYSLGETLGDMLYLRGWQPGSVADLIWTLPTTAFIILILRDAIVQEENQQPGSLVRAVRHTRGLSVAALAFLSFGVSALLASRHLLLGGIFMACSFIVFALRTNSREDAWQEAHGRLEEAALQDALTGLGNRLQLRSCLSKRLTGISSSCTVTLMFLDLDSFKSINDSLGHANGDKLLIEVASRLRSGSPSGSSVCRLGGDEFVVLTSVRNSVEAETLAEGILLSLNHPFEIGGHVVRCSASIGVVIASPEDAMDDLLRTADHAMYRAKQLGKNRVQLFEPSIMAQMGHRWQLEADLRDSLERGEIEVAYQPILTVEGSTITGFEALARWNHPQHGPIAPAEFIPLAEETGLILALGAQVLEKASRQVAQWNMAWNKRFTVSVNVSSKQFADGGFLHLLMSTLDRTGLDPCLLRLEITESVLLVQESTVRHVLMQARAHGIHISLDDFGTGYSSLSLLLNLPVDEVKVDRSFVADMHLDPQKKELVRTVVQLGHSLGKRVVAEGVESEQELGELAAMGCECAQGWLISRPLLPQMLEENISSILAQAAGTKERRAFMSCEFPALEIELMRLEVTM